MKKSIILIGWFFIAVGGRGVVHDPNSGDPDDFLVKHPRVAIQLGPFDTRSECENFRTFMQEGGFKRVSICWESTS